MLPKYSLMMIKPKDVEFNENNPRGEKPEDIEGDPEFEQLKDSVYKYGVLVPIVVHKQSQPGAKPYHLVDGERRLRAALATNVPEIPAHIREGTDQASDLKEAFHIHMLRKQWTPLARARALKQILQQMQIKGDKPDKEGLLEELQAATGCTDTQLKALRRATRFPDSVLTSVSRGELGFSHLVQIEESCIEPVSKEFPEVMKKIGRRAARASLVEKAKSKVLTSTRALMYNLVPVIVRAKQEGAAQRAYAAELIETFLLKPGIAGEMVLRKYEARFPRTDQDVVHLVTEVVEASQTLGSMLARMEGGDLSSLPALRKQITQELQDLKTAISKTLRQIGRARL